MEKRQGWPWFFAWAAAGGLLFFAFLSGFTIGIFVLPFAAVGVWLVGRAGRAWPELLGGLAGAGLVLLGIAFINRDSTPCPESGSMTSGPGETATVSCGGTDPVPWLVAGLVLVGIGAAAYAVARARLPRAPAGSAAS